MRYLYLTGHRLDRVLMVVAVFYAFSAVLPAASLANSQNASGDLSDTTTIAVRAGNAEAIATCLNLAKAGEKANQTNGCYNYAYARGGKVIITNVEVVAGRANDKDGIISIDSNTVNFTVKGGNATAIASCINQAQGGRDVDQRNKCINVAIAIGGNVIITNVNVVLVEGK